MLPRNHSIKSPPTPPPQLPLKRQRDVWRQVIHRPQARKQVSAQVIDAQCASDVQCTLVAMASTSLVIRALLSNLLSRDGLRPSN